MRCLIVILLFCLNLPIHGQRHPKCGANPVTMGDDCAGACVVCDLNGTSFRNILTGSGQMPPGYCTMFIHGIQWLAFVAGSTSLSLNVQVNNCNSNNGLEMGIYESPDCNSFNLVSNCNTNMYNNMTWPFTTTSALKVGCVYYLVFDGNGPTICNALITVTAGSAKAPVPNTNDKIIGPTRFCKNGTAEYTINKINGACSYEWSVKNGTIVQSLDNKCTVIWDNPGIGFVCVKGINECNIGNEVCLMVEIGDDSPITEIGPFFVCPNETYLYKGILHPSGVHQLMLKNIFQCDSIIELEVIENEPAQSIVDTFICSYDSLVIQNNVFKNTGNYTIISKSKIKPYCDSIINLNLTSINLKAIVNKTNDLSCSDSTSLLFADSIIFRNNIKYIWLNEKNDTISRDSNIRVTKSGNYRLILQSKSIQNLCVYQTSIEVKGSNVPPKLELTDTIKICDKNFLFLSQINFKEINQTNSTYSFHSNSSCTPQNEIKSSQIIITKDTVIYLLAQSGNCQDILRIPIKHLLPSQISTDDISLCQGDSINLSNLNFKWFDSTRFAYHFFEDADSMSAEINMNYIADSSKTIFIIPQGVHCPIIDSFKINVTPTPDSKFSIPKELCVTDSIPILFSKKQIDYLKYIITQKDTLHINSNNKILFIKPYDTGILNICLHVEDNHCPDFTCETIKIYPIPELPSIECRSTDTSIQFYWKTNPSLKLSGKSLSGQNPSQITDSSILFNSLARGEKVKIQVTARNGYCPDETIEIECESIQCKPIKLDILPIDPICLNGTNLDEQLQFRSSDTLTNPKIIWRGKGIKDSTNGTFNATMAGIGNHFILLSIRDEGCIYNTFTNIRVRRNPFSDFDLDSLVCLDSSIVVHFKGQYADSSNFNWQFDNAEIDSIIKDKQFGLKWKTSGRKKIKLKLIDQTCESEVEKEIEVLEPLQVPEINCTITDSTIQFHWKKIKRATKYKINLIYGNPGILIADSIYLIKKRSPFDSAFIILKIEDEGPCSDQESPAISCKSPLCPPLKTVKDTVLHFCSNAPVAINLDQFIIYPDTNRSWIGNEINKSLLETKKLSSGKYIYSLLSTKDHCDYSDTLNIEITDPPLISSVDITPIPCDPLLNYGSITLNKVISNYLPIKYSINNSNYSIESVFPNLIEGQYILSIQDALGCIKDTSISLLKPPTPSIDLGNDLEVFAGSPVNLFATIKGDYSKLQWISPVPLSCDQDCIQTKLLANQDLDLYCLIINENGCTDVDTLLIRVIDHKIFVPNTFSPNGDGINDYFTIFGNATKIKILNIFDRWGNLVFTGNDLALGNEATQWNGFSHGKNCLPGVYVYYSELIFERGKNETIQGEFTLLR